MAHINAKNHVISRYLTFRVESGIVWKEEAVWKSFLHGALGDVLEKLLSGRFRRQVSPRAFKKLRIFCFGANAQQERDERYA